VLNYKSKTRKKVNRLKNGQTKRNGASDPSAGSLNAPNGSFRNSLHTKVKRKDTYYTITMFNVAVPTGPKGPFLATMFNVAVPTGPAKAGLVVFNVVNHD
jgi:hypothetical protein